MTEIGQTGRHACRRHAVHVAAEVGGGGTAMMNIASGSRLVPAGLGTRAMMVMGLVLEHEVCLR